jgi:hypothetical protein
MNFLRMNALIALLLCSTWVLADDPRVHVDDPMGSFTPVGLSFSFTSNGTGGGDFSFTNTSGVAFTSLEINAAAPMPPAPITCGGNAFAVCFQQESLTEGGFATIDFFGGPGIANGHAFSIDLGASGWTPNATFTAFANGTHGTTPEPGMLALVATGIGALWLRIKTSA